MAVYPLLFGTTPQADPGLAHTTAISNVTQLQAMTASGNYYLTGNIDASITSTWNGGAGFIPIGVSGIPFVGTLDMCGYTISNLHINRNSNGQSLLGFVGPNAAVANGTLSNVDITGGGYWCGSLASYVQSSVAGDILIQNCHASGTIKSYGAGMGYYGGLIGQILRVGSDPAGTTYVYDSDCSCTLDQVNATIYSYRGGFVGIAAFSVINNCYATGSFVNLNIGDVGQCLGGFVGRLSNDNLVAFCHATGDVLGGGRYLGGFVGIAAQTSYMSNCYATGDVEGDQEIGGFAGVIDASYNDPSCFDCYAEGNAVANGIGYAGGFCGASNSPNAVFENCYSIGSANAATYYGGFIGSAAPALNVTACFWDIEASGNLTTSQNKGEGKITKWFRKQKHFTDYGWDFATVWYLPAFGRQIIMGKPRSSYLMNCPHTTHRNVYI